MNIFRIRLGLITQQEDLINSLKAAGCKVIQTSDGLCVKATTPLSDLQNKISILNDMEINTIDSSEYDSQPKDVQAFIHSH